MSVVQDRIASVNVKDTLDNVQAAGALRKVIDQTAPEIIGLQEWGRHRDSILQALKRDGWAWARSSVGGGPVPFKADRYALVRCRAHVLATRSFVGRLPGRRPTLDDSLATLVLLYDEVLDEEVCVVNYHLTAEVQDRHGNYHDDAAHAPRVKRHKREVATLRRIARNQKRKGRRCYFIGDSNFDGLQIPPLVSCWHQRPGGTLGSRAVDCVHAPQKAADVQIIPTASDHHAITVTYKRSQS